MNTIRQLREMVDLKEILFDNIVAAYHKNKANPNLYKTAITQMAKRFNISEAELTKEVPLSIVIQRLLIYFNSIYKENERI